MAPHKSEPDHRIGRRQLLAGALVGLAAGVGLPAAGLLPGRVQSKKPAVGPSDPSEILARIRPPRFPNRVFDVREYGAARDGETDCRPAFARAIGECHERGGGRVIVPAGTYLCNGPIHLADDVNFHLEDGATVRFGTNPADYLPPVLVRWESTRCYNYSPLIYAFQQQNIAITGKGTLDGQAQIFWGDWKLKQTKDQALLRDMGAKRVPLERRLFGDGHHLRPTFCEFYDCRNVLIEGVTLKRSPFWTVHPVFCTNVTISGIRVLPGTTNDDGCDPDSCRDVLIEDCVFETSDDNISIKAGRDQDAWGGRPCENVVIRRCRGVRSRANAYAIGSEMSGDVRNLFILDSAVGEVDGNLVAIKSNSDRGGTVENIWVRGLMAGACETCIQLQTDYKGVQDHPYPPQYRSLHFEKLACRTARRSAIRSVGTAAKPIDGVYLKDIAIETAASDIEIANTRQIEMRNVTINGRLVRAPEG
jgi:polygalacturonase